VLYVNTSAEVCLELARAMNDEQSIPVIEKMAADIEPLTDDEWAITLEEALEL
jgi:hypothetical protein